jgi:hypothetical protein
VTVSRTYMSSKGKQDRAPEPNLASY